MSAKGPCTHDGMPAPGVDDAMDVAHAVLETAAMRVHPKARVVALQFVIMHPCDKAPEKEDAVHVVARSRHDEVMTPEEKAEAAATLAGLLDDYVEHAGLTVNADGDFVEKAPTARGRA